MSSLAHALRHRSSWRRLAAVAFQSPAWPALVAALVVMSLLVAFERVVSGAVEQGHQRRAAAAAKLDDTWRCKALRRLSERDGCLVKLGDPPDPLALRAGGALVLTTLEQP
jgi:hypothetical protein